MSSDPTFPILVKYSATRRRWQSTWYDTAGKRHSKSFGWEHDTNAKQARRRYDHWMMMFRDRPDIRNPQSEDAEYSVTRLCAQYLRHCYQTYRKRGKATSHVWNVRMAVRELNQAHGSEAAASLDAPKLAALRDAMVYGKGQRGQVRLRTAKTVNERIGLIQKAYKWAREKGRVPAATVADLLTVGRLKGGRGDAQKSKPVKSIGIPFVEATLKHLPPTVQAMVKLLGVTGMRPEEVCGMRGREIETGGDVWLYRPASHKLEHQDGGEVIRFLGPQAQAIITPYLKLDTTAYLFSPRDAHGQRLEAKRKGRKVKLWPSHAKKHKSDPTARLSDHYTTPTLRRAIHYACKLAEIAPWGPNRLRHSVATRLRKKYGIEDASIQLGHKHLSTTEIYAEKDAQRAMQIAREVG